MCVIRFSGWKWSVMAWPWRFLKDPFLQFGCNKWCRRTGQQRNTVFRDVFFQDSVSEVVWDSRDEVWTGLTSSDTCNLEILKMFTWQQSLKTTWDLNILLVAYHKEQSILTVTLLWLCLLNSKTRTGSYHLNVDLFQMYREEEWFIHSFHCKSQILSCLYASFLTRCWFIGQSGMQ